MRSDEPVTVASLADDLRAHPNTVREHLDALVEDGRVERTRASPKGRGRPAWLYSSIVKPDDADALSGPVGTDGQEYVALAVALIDEVAQSSPDPRSTARQAGERWGRALAEEYVASLPVGQLPEATTDKVVEMLRELRFEPQQGEDPKTVRLTTCPFLDSARRHPEVVCQVHLGIMRGALEQLGGSADGAALEPFAEPGACLMNLPEVQ